MKTKILFITLSLCISSLTSCTDKKKTEKEIETKVISKEAKTPIKNVTEENERLKLDSIRQVKEHGHAH